MARRSFVRTLRAANRGARTIEAYMLAINQLADYLAARDDAPATVAGLKREHVEDFLSTKLAEGMASSTVNQRYRSLHRFYTFLHEEEEIAANPMERMPPPTIPEQPVPVLQEDQIRALLNTARSRDFLDLRDTAIIRLLIDTGMRRAELPGYGSTSSTSTKTSRSCSGKAAVSGPAPSARRPPSRSTATSAPAHATFTVTCPPSGSPRRAH